MIIAIKSAAEFDAQVLGVAGPIFALFTAKWCPYCRIQEPRLKELEAKLNLQFAIVDVDAAVGVDERYDVQTIPSLLIFKEGVLTNREMIAYLQPHELESFVKEQLPA